jgi:hypothetical protein
MSPFNLASLRKRGGLGDARYFRTSGSIPIGTRLAQVKAVGAGRSGPEAVLDLAVLKKRKSEGVGPPGTSPCSVRAGAALKKPG